MVFVRPQPDYQRASQPTWQSILGAPAIGTGGKSRRSPDPAPDRPGLVGGPRRAPGAAAGVPEHRRLLADSAQPAAPAGLRRLDRLRPHDHLGASLPPLQQHRAQQAARDHGRARLPLRHDLQDVRRARAGLADHAAAHHHARAGAACPVRAGPAARTGARLGNGRLPGAAPHPARTASCPALSRIAGRHPGPAGPRLLGHGARRRRRQGGRGAC